MAVNQNIRFEGCVFHQMTCGASGGIWVRNWTDRVESRNIRFQNCEFYKSGADEVLGGLGMGRRGAGGRPLGLRLL